MAIEGNGHMVETTVKGSPVVACTSHGISDVDLLTDEIVSEQLTRYFFSFAFHKLLYYDGFDIIFGFFFLCLKFFH